MKQRILKNWWVLLLAAAIIGAPFALARQNAPDRGESPPVINLSAGDEAEITAVRALIAALDETSGPDQVAAARTALEALPYSDRYGLTDEAQKLAALEAGLVPPETTEPEPPPSEETAFDPGASRLEILLALLPAELDAQMADLLRVTYEELDQESRAALPPAALARYWDSQPDPGVEDAALAETTDDGDGQPETTEDNPPAEAGSGVFVGSRSSDKYHLPSCSSAKRIKEENKVWFASAQDAKARGYSPCSICSP